MAGAGLAYNSQFLYDLLGTEGAPVTLTTSYLGNVSPALLAQGIAEATYFYEYTPGAGGGGNSFQIKIMGSPDEPTDANQVFYQESFENIVGSTGTLVEGERTFVGTTASTTYRGFFLVPPAYKQLQVAAKENIVGGAAGTLVLRVLLSGN